ncbi:MAG: hypothetical protein SX243_17925 [Acidobacteriota bacterium]|nr:hypothetical protein [Acidobacteriota bacterium]
MVEFDGRLYFLGSENEVVAGSVPGPEGLWTSDGTDQGTVPVVLFEEDISTLFSAGGIGIFQDRMYFRGADSETGRELWVSDGTTEGTRQLNNGAPDVQSTVFGELHAQEQRFFFNATQADGEPALWASDGTTAGTESLLVHPDSSDRFMAEELTSIGDRLYFRRTEAETPRSQSLWTSDGTVAGTQRLFTGERVDNLGVFGSRLCFSGQTEDHGQEPWCTDGSVEGTRLLRDLRPGTDQSGNPPSSFPREWLQVGDRLFFEAIDEDFRVELWVSDGTRAGTQPLIDLVSVDLDQIAPILLTAVEKDAYFFSRGPLTVPGSGSAVWLWRIDGETLAVTPIREVAHPGAVPRFGETVGFRGRFIFSLTDATGPRLMRSDGTDAGTLPLLEIDASPFGSLPQELTVVGNDLFFVLQDNEGGEELWATDGTPEGTRRVSNLLPGSDSSQPYSLTRVGSALLFAATDGVHGFEPWISDGTAEGTQMVADLHPGPGSSLPGSFAVVGERGYFDAWTDETGRELWSLDVSELASRTCEPRDGRFCLGEGRYEVLLDWRDPRTGDVGRASGEPLTTDTGQLWFFDSENLEVITKILDGTAVNGFSWVFYGSLTDLAFWLSAVDLHTGVSNTYVQKDRETCGGADVRAFPLDPGTSALVTAEAALGSNPPRYLAAPVTGACVPDATTLCLLGGRFQLRLEWSDQRRPGRTGDGMAVEGTDQTGYFWFFQESNLELMVKVLDGRPVNGNFWVFYGSLTDVEFTMTVTDTVSGAQTTYHNEPGNICGRTDTAAFEG